METEALVLSAIALVAAILLAFYGLVLFARRQAANLEIQSQKAAYYSQLARKSHASRKRNAAATEDDEEDDEGDDEEPESMSKAALKSALLGLAEEHDLNPLKLKRGDAAEWERATAIAKEKLGIKGGAAPASDGSGRLL